eukprot:2009513-Prymnesium_polylepis.2
MSAVLLADAGPPRRPRVAQALLRLRCSRGQAEARPDRRVPAVLLPPPGGGTDAVGQACCLSCRRKPHPAAPHAAAVRDERTTPCNVCACNRFYSRAPTLSWSLTTCSTIAWVRRRREGARTRHAHGSASAVPVRSEPASAPRRGPRTCRGAHPLCPPPADGRVPSRPLGGRGRGRRGAGQLCRARRAARVQLEQRAAHRHGQAHAQDARPAAAVSQAVRRRLQSQRRVLRVASINPAGRTGGEHRTERAPPREHATATHAPAPRRAQAADVAGGGVGPHQGFDAGPAIPPAHVGDDAVCGRGGEAGVGPLDWRRVLGVCHAQAARVWRLRHGCLRGIAPRVQCASGMGGGA